MRLPQLITLSVFIALYAFGIKANAAICQAGINYGSQNWDGYRYGDAPTICFLQAEERCLAVTQVVTCYPADGRCNGVFTSSGRPCPSGMALNQPVFGGKVPERPDDSDGGSDGGGSDGGGSDGGGSDGGGSDGGGSDGDNGRDRPHWKYSDLPIRQVRTPPSRVSEKNWGLAEQFAYLADVDRNSTTYLRAEIRDQTERLNQAQSINTTNIYNMTRATQHMGERFSDMGREIARLNDTVFKFRQDNLTTMQRQKEYFEAMMEIQKGSSEAILTDVFVDMNYRHPRFHTRMKFNDAFNEMLKQQSDTHLAIGRGNNLIYDLHETLKRIANNSGGGSGGGPFEDVRPVDAEILEDFYYALQGEFNNVTSSLGQSRESNERYLSAILDHLQNSSGGDGLDDGSGNDSDGDADGNGSGGGSGGVTVNVDTSRIESSLADIKSALTADASNLGACQGEKCPEGYYRSNYENGFRGIFEANFANTKSIALAGVTDIFGKIDISNAAAPNLCLNLYMYGSFCFTDYINFDWIFAFIRAAFMFTTVMLCRKLVVGG